MRELAKTITTTTQNKNTKQTTMHTKETTYQTKKPSFLTMDWLFHKHYGNTTREKTNKQKNIFQIQLFPPFHFYFILKWYFGF